MVSYFFKCVFGALASMVVFLAPAAAFAALNQSRGDYVRLNETLLDIIYTTNPMEDLDVLHSISYNRALTLFLAAHIMIEMDSEPEPNESAVIKGALKEMTSIKDHFQEQIDIRSGGKNQDGPMTLEVIALERAKTYFEKWMEEETLLLFTLGVDGYIYQHFIENDISPPFSRPMAPWVPTLSTPPNTKPYDALLETLNRPPKPAFLTVINKSQKDKERAYTYALVLSVARQAVVGLTNRQSERFLMEEALSQLGNYLELEVMKESGFDLWLEEEKEKLFKAGIDNYLKDYFERNNLFFFK